MINESARTIDWLIILILLMLNTVIWLLMATKQILGFCHKK